MSYLAHRVEKIEDVGVQFRRELECMYLSKAADADAKVVWTTDLLENWEEKVMEILIDERKTNSGNLKITQ